MAVVVFQGHLYCYCNDGVLGLKKIWKRCFVVLNNDSLFVAYKSESQEKKLYETKLQDNALWLAFGKDAEKYGAPNCEDSIFNVENTYLIAIPKNKDREMVAWFAAGSQEIFKAWIHAMAVTVKSTSKPPVLGGKRFEHKLVSQKIRHIFNLSGKAEDWEIYWLAGSIGESGSDFSKPPTPMPTPLPRRTELVGVPILSKQEVPIAVTQTPSVPIPQLRRSLVPLVPLNLLDSNWKDSDVKNGKTFHSATITIVGKGVDQKSCLKGPSSEIRKTSGDFSPQQLYYEVNFPTEYKEVVTEESHWTKGHSSGRTIRCVECTTRKLSNN